MTISTAKQGVWILDDTYKKVASEYWGYDNAGDPGVSSYWIWGIGTSGEQGDSTLSSKSSPVQLPGTWCRFSNGNGFAIKTNGTLWGWGNNLCGKLGNSTTINTSSPIQIPGTQWSKVTSTLSTLAIKTDGTLWSWGYNTQGQMGDQTLIARSSPVQVPGTAWCHVSFGYRQSSALKTDGTLWVWGFSGDTQGQLGQVSNNIPRSSPVQIPGTAWVDVDMQIAPVARKSDGTLWIWGNNYYGTLGNDCGGAAQYKCSPIQVTGTSWTAASPGGSLGRQVLATKNDGTLWAWGRNNCGQLGDGTVANRSTPVQIPGTQWSSTIATGQYQSFALKTNSTLWMWGGNDNGELGQSNVIPKSSPIQVPGTTWSNVYKTHHGASVAKKTNL